MQSKLLDSLARVVYTVKIILYGFSLEVLIASVFFPELTKALLEEAIISLVVALITEPERLFKPPDH